MKPERSSALFARARTVIPGGVNSPVRALRSVGHDPVFIVSAIGATMRDADGNEYIDYVGSWGPMIHGHSHPAIIGAIKEAAANGTSFGAATEPEVVMAELVCSMVPSVEMVRMVNSGTEATMSAIRLARAFTGKTKMLKFEGCYHGHGDSFLIRAGSGAMTFSSPDSPGVPAAVAEQTLIAPYNDLTAVGRVLDANRGEVACIIVEPVAGNMGCVPPHDGFLQGLRRMCDEHGVLLIFDEVMTGFRLAAGGAQELFGVRPDLTTLGKVIGGGLPVGAYGGRKDIMKQISPEGPVYQAGTLSGNPLAMSAGIEALRLLNEDPGFYRTLEEKGRMLEEGIRENLVREGAPMTVNRVGSMLTLFFSPEPVTDYLSAVRCDTAMFARYFTEMLTRGIYLPPSQFEAAFLSAAHTEEEIERTLKANRESIRAVLSDG